MHGITSRAHGVSDGWRNRSGVNSRATVDEPFCTHRQAPSRTASCTLPAACSLANASSMFTMASASASSQLRSGAASQVHSPASFTHFHLVSPRITPVSASNRRCAAALACRAARRGEDFADDAPTTSAAAAARLFAGTAAASLALLAAAGGAHADSSAFDALTPDQTFFDAGHVLSADKAAAVSAQLADLERTSGWRVRMYTNYQLSGQPTETQLRSAWRPDKRTVVIRVGGWKAWTAELGMDSSDRQYEAFQRRFIGLVAINWVTAVTPALDQMQNSTHRATLYGLQRAAATNQQTCRPPARLSNACSSPAYRWTLPPQTYSPIPTWAMTPLRS